jgi:hypothetical protein
MCHQKRDGSDPYETKNPGFRDGRAIGVISYGKRESWQDHGKQAYDTQ